MFRGKPVATLKAGRYTFSVSDQSAKGGFILQQIKQGANTLTGVAYVGKRSVDAEPQGRAVVLLPDVRGRKDLFHRHELRFGGRHDSGEAIARRLALGAALLAAAVFVPVVSASSRDAAPPATPTLYVNYTMNCTFSIVDDSGKPVTSIAPGTYQVMVTTPIMFKLVIPGGPGIDNMAPGDMTGCRGWVQFQLTGPRVNLQHDARRGLRLATCCCPRRASSRARPTPPSTSTSRQSTRDSFSTLATGTPTIPTKSPYDGDLGQGRRPVRACSPPARSLAKLNGTVEREWPGRAD